MTGSELDRLLNDDLSDRRESHQLRQRRIIKSIDAVHIDIDGRRYVNFASNNYLGLTHHPRVIAAARESIERYGVGSGASALITGCSDEHAAAEHAIARLKGTESAVLLPSGYQANHAAVQTLAAVGKHRGRAVRFIVDKLAHASLIDAVRASDAEMRIFPHNHLAKLSRLLDDAPADEMQVVLTESIFSMDGDAVDLEGLAELKRRRPFLLLLDEAHATGVYGPDGAGYAAERGLQAVVDVSVVTLSKALGCIGGAVCGSRAFCESLINHGRAYIYSTSVPQYVANVARVSINVLRDEPSRQRRVRELAMRVRDELRGKFDIPNGDAPIVPIILGGEAAALLASERLCEKGMIAIAVRPPTVPRGSSRLRVTLSCEHGDEDIENLVAELKAM